MKLLVVWFLVIDEWLHGSSSVMPLQALSKKGVRVSCIFPVLRAVPDITSDNFRIDGIGLRRVVPIASYLWFFLKAYVLFLRRHQDADIVIVDATDAFLFAIPILLRATGLMSRPRFVVREASPPVEIEKTHSYYLPAIHHLSMIISRYSDTIFAISPMRREEMHRKYRIPDDKIGVWTSSVDTKLFDPAIYRTSRDTIRKELCPRDKYLLMYHGVLSQERGLSELVKAIGIVHRQRADVVLLLLGKGPDESSLKELVRSSGLSDVVIFHKAVAYSDVPQFIAAADIGLVPLPDHPQWRYQNPTKLLEYLAMAKPVVITDIPAHRWIVDDPRIAFFCKKGRSTEIAEAILRCLDSYGIAGEINKVETLDKFSPSAIADSLLKTLIQELPDVTRGS